MLKAQGRIAFNKNETATVEIFLVGFGTSRDDQRLARDWQMVFFIGRR